MKIQAILALVMLAILITIGFIKIVIHSIGYKGSNYADFLNEIKQLEATL